MKRHIIMLSLAVCVIYPAMAQEKADTTDAFNTHLTLNELVITGLTGSTALRSSPTPVSTVSGRQLRSGVSSNIVDALAKVPGISQIGTGPGISKPVIRGLGFNRVIVISDGVRQEGQQWGEEHGLEIDAATVGSVEILKGPASLMYGSDALAGVIILKPYPFPISGTKVNFISEYQSNNGLFGASFNVCGKNGDFVWDATLSTRAAHEYRNRYDGFVSGSAFSDKSGRLSLGINKIGGYSRLSLSVYGQEPEIVSGERNPLDGSLLGSHGRTYTAVAPLQRITHYKAVWDNLLHLNNGDLKVTLGAQRNQRKEFEEDLDECEQYLLLRTFTYDARYLFSPYEKIKFAAGAGGMWQGSRNLAEEMVIPQYKLFDIGPFITASSDLGRLNISGGLRYDRRALSSEEAIEDGDIRFSPLRRDYSSLSASLGAALAIGDNVISRINIARGFRAPNISELTSNGVHEGTMRYEVGDSSLQPERSLQADLGLDVSLPGIKARAAAFVNSIDGFIYNCLDPNQLIYEGLPVYNYGQRDALLRGLESEIDWHPVHILHLNTAFSMVRGSFRDNFGDLPLIPAPTLRNEIRIELTHRANTFNNAYICLSSDSFIAQKRVFSLNGTETPTPGVTLFGTAFGTDIKLRGKKVAELYINIDNLTDRAYQSHLSRLKYCSVNPVTGRAGVFNMGRNAGIKLIIRQ